MKVGYCLREREIADYAIYPQVNDYKIGYYGILFIILDTEAKTINGQPINSKQMIESLSIYNTNRPHDYNDLNKQIRDVDCFIVSHELSNATWTAELLSYLTNKPVRCADIPVDTLLKNPEYGKVLRPINEFKDIVYNPFELIKSFDRLDLLDALFYIPDNEDYINKFADAIISYGEKLLNDKDLLKYEFQGNTGFYYSNTRRINNLISSLIFSNSPIDFDKVIKVSNTILDVFYLNFSTVQSNPTVAKSFRDETNLVSSLTDQYATSRSSSFRQYYTKGFIISEKVRGFLESNCTKVVQYLIDDALSNKIKGLKPLSKYLYSPEVLYILTNTDIKIGKLENTKEFSDLLIKVLNRNPSNKNIKDKIIHSSIIYGNNVDWSQLDDSILTLKFPDGLTVDGKTYTSKKAENKGHEQSNYKPYIVNIFNENPYNFEMMIENSFMLLNLLPKEDFELSKEFIATKLNIFIYTQFTRTNGNAYFASIIYKMCFNEDGLICQYNMEEVLKEVYKIVKAKNTKIAAAKFAYFLYQTKLYDLMKDSLDADIKKCIMEIKLKS